MLNLLLLVLLASHAPQEETRPFHMGFTPWPYDLSLDGMTTSVKFAEEHGDIVSIMLMGGLPWQEALEGKPYSKNVQETLAYHPAGKKIFVSIVPLNMGRDGMAPYWGEKDNLPLPEPWASMALNDPRAKRAFLKFATDVVETMHPDYLAIGVEDNVLLSKNPAKWAQLKDLHRATYKALKTMYPSLPVFFTTDLSHYLHGAAESRNTPQEAEVADLMQSSDLFAMSFYPYMSLNFGEATSPGFLDFAKKMGKPIAVSESGMTSRDVTLPSYHVTLTGSDAQQVSFTNFLLKTAKHDHYKFVINFATTDFDPLVKKLGAPINEIASIWEFTGMQDSTKTQKPAFRVWDRYLKMPYSPTH